MAETEPGPPRCPVRKPGIRSLGFRAREQARGAAAERPRRARIENTGEEGRRQPAILISHHPRGEELPVNHLVVSDDYGALGPTKSEQAKDAGRPRTRSGTRPTEDAGMRRFAAGPRVA